MKCESLLSVGRKKFGLVAAASLIAWSGASAPYAWAENRGGFQPGGRTFTNPFANPSAPGTPNAPGNPGGGFFDEEEEEGNAPTPQNPANPTAPNTGGPQRPSGSQGTTNAPQKKTEEGVSMGGGPPGGVIEHNKVEPVTIDTETGAGSKEVVTEFNYPNADIMDIAKTLGKLTGKNFILDKDVKGTITIISNSPITVGDAWRAFLTALDINNFALIPSGKYIRIAKQRDARDKQLSTYTGEFAPETDALITRVFPLKYIGAEEVSRVLRSFMPTTARIIAHEQTNTLIVTDTGANIGKLAKMLEILDVEGFDAGIEVIPVKFASAADLSKLIDTLIPGTGGTTGPPGAPRFGYPGRFNARRTKEGGMINTIIADERTNTLIVHANSKGAEQVRELVAKLDQKVAFPTGGGKVHVIYLQFADAEAIATTLNNLTSAAGGGFKPTTAPGGTTGTGVNPVAASLFEGNVKIAPDKSTNSLVVTASPSDYATVFRVINRLDIPRDEVYVEVVIMEIKIGHNFQFSSNFVSPASGLGSITNGDLASFLQNPAGLQGALLGFKAGNQNTITIGGTPVQISNVTGLIRAIQSKTDANILATPQIIALDNTEATFESNSKIPVPTSTAVQGAGVSNSFSKETVTLKIVIKPQINKLSNFVKLDVDTKLEDIDNSQVPAQLVGQAFGTSGRNAKTTVVVADGDTVVIGGLIRTTQNEQVTKIPIFGDIPLLGWLFRSKTDDVSKSNLLVFLTPHIVRQYEKVRALLDKKLKERDDFIETNGGGVDPFRETRDEMIRALPDIKDIMNKKVQTAFSIDEEKSEIKEKPANPFTGENPPAMEAPPIPPTTAPRPQSQVTQPQAAPPAATVPQQTAPETAPPPVDTYGNPIPPPPMAPPVPQTEPPMGGPPTGAGG